MSNFMTWLEFMGAMQPAPTSSRPGFETNKEDKILELWDRIFTDLGYKGDPPSKTVTKTLEELTETEPGKTSGKTIAARLRRVMDELSETDPELAGNVQKAMGWLEDESENQIGEVAPKKEFAEFLKMVFGEDQFMELLNRDPKSSDATPTPQPGAYSPDGGAAGPTAPPAPEMDAPPAPGQEIPGQPQLPADQQLQQPPPVQNPPPPAGIGGPVRMSSW